MSDIKLEFCVASQTKLGQQVYICGNVEPLGNWNPKKSFKLYTDQAIYPEWKSSSPIIIRAETLLQFKACVLDTDQNFIKWEDLIGNRNTCLLQSSIISFEMSKPLLSYSTLLAEIPSRVIIPVRKGTQQVLGNLDNLDDYSDSSSGNERGWSEMNSHKIRRATMLMNLFIQEIKITFQKPNTHLHEKNFEENPEYYNLIQDVIVLPNILPLQVNSYNRQRQNSYKKSEERIEKISQNYFFKDIFKELDDKIYIYHFLYSHQKNHLFQNIQGFSKILMFHLSKKQIWEADKCPQIIEPLLQISQFNIICTNEEQKILMIVNFCKAKPDIFKVKMLSERVIKIDIKQETFVHLIFYEDLIEFNSFSKNKNKSLNFRNFYEKINMPLSASFKADQFIHIDHFRDINKRKRCIIVRCTNLNEISQQIKKDLIGISSRKNIEVCLYISQECKCIKNRIPLDETNKFLVISCFGDIMCSDGKIQNFLSSLSLNQQKCKNFYASLLDKISIWEENIISTNLIKNSLYLSLKNSKVSSLIGEFLEQDIKKFNQTSRYKYSFEKFTKDDEIEIICKPDVLSNSFLSKANIAMYEEEVLQPEVLLFDYSKLRQSFLNFSNSFKSICGYKKMKYEGFRIDDKKQEFENINEQKMYQILLAADQATQKSQIISGKN